MSVIISVHTVNNYVHMRYVWIFSIFCVAITAKTTDVKLGVILPEDSIYPWSLKRVVPAIDLAVKTVQDLGILPDCNITVKTADSHCSETLGPLAAVDFHMMDHVNVFFGPVCDYAIAPVARFSPYWNIAVLSAGALVADFDNKTEYKLLTRVQGAYSNGADFILDINHNFNWTRVGLIYHDNKAKGKGKSNCYFRMEALFFKLQSLSRVAPWNLAFDENQPERYDFEEILKEASLNSRIVVLCASADSVRDIMIKAHDLNFDNGEYVFFNIDLFSSKNESKKPWYREGEGEKERNEKAKKAYEALMTVTLRKPTSPEYKNFSREVKARAKKRYTNFTYGEEEVNSFVGAFHDAVILYAIALNETLEANRTNISNGTEITRRMWNRTFRGITGNVSIDDNGDRNADYSLLDMDPDTGEFEVVANYFGNTKQYEPVPGKHIRWAGNYDHAPPDTPKCGFDNSKCPPDKPFPEYGIVIIVLGTLLVIVLVAAFFIYRHVKLEAELAEMNWRVKWEDIMLGTIEGDRKMKKQAASNLSLARTDDTSLESHLLIERSRSSNLSSTTSSLTWCKCSQCEETDRNRRVCCRHIDKLEDRLETERCITSTKDFQDVVLNSQVLLTVYIHVMLARKQRGAAPTELNPYKCRLMAARQFLCWLHSGEALKRETKWAIPACVLRAIKLMFPDVGAEMTSGDDACSLTLEDILPIENNSSV